MSRGIGLYLHIPFCASRCPYCDFATAPARTALRAAYLDALREEIAREGRMLDRPRIRTFYVGGGTPSLLDPSEIESVGRRLREAFDLRPREATVEVNPATLDRERLGAWLELGVTRISLGAQSFDARGLRALGRTHQSQDSTTAFMAARDAGLDVNLDLIFGWPGQTVADWQRDLESAIALGPDHGSGYPIELRTYIAHARSGSARSADLESDPRAEAAMLALRLDTGLDLRHYGIRFGDEAASRVRLALADVSRARLVRWSGDRASLTARGPLLASEG